MWVDVADASLPVGTLTNVHVGGEDIVVARVGEWWAAVSGACTHDECPLADGWLEDTALRCPCHAALFDLATGEPVEGPATEPLVVYPVRVQLGRVEVEHGGGRRS
ncbi:MAG: Rieske 2Fe-2S domain-containing protein [Gaiellales bacterium]